MGEGRDLELDERGKKEGIFPKKFTKTNCEVSPSLLFLIFLNKILY